MMNLFSDVIRNDETKRLWSNKILSIANVANRLLAMSTNLSWSYWIKQVCDPQKLYY